jgi:hypothetical protein
MIIKITLPFIVFFIILFNYNVSLAVTGNDILLLCDSDASKEMSTTKINHLACSYLLLGMIEGFTFRSVVHGSIVAKNAKPPREYEEFVRIFWITALRGFTVPDSGLNFDEIIERLVIFLKNNPDKHEASAAYVVGVVLEDLYPADINLELNRQNKNIESE